MADERLRELERAAETDEAARLLLERERDRLGLPPLRWLAFVADGAKKRHLVHKPTKGELSTAAFPLCGAGVLGRRPAWTAWGQDPAECRACRRRLAGAGPEETRALRERHLQLGERLLGR